MKKIEVVYKHLQSDNGTIIMPNGIKKSFAKLGISGNKLLLYENKNADNEYRLKETISLLWRNIKTR